MIAANDDISCGMSLDQFGEVMRRAKAEVLTKRQHEIVALIQKGVETKEIARRLGIAPATVKAHLAIIYAKCGVPNRVALAGLGLLPSVPAYVINARQGSRSGHYVASMANKRSGVTYDRLVK